MITEKEREEIRKEAKDILDRFASALEKLEVKEKELESFIGGFREEGNGKNCDMEFRERMFLNAPNKEGDCIIAEKKKW